MFKHLSAFLFLMYSWHFCIFLQIQDRYVGNQAGSFIPSTLIVALRLYLDLHVIRVNAHILGDHFGNVCLDQFHHLRRTVYPVRYQQDFQPVFRHLAGTFPAKKMFHIHLSPSYAFRKIPVTFVQKDIPFSKSRKGISLPRRRSTTL